MKPISDAELLKILAKAWEDFEGDTTVLASAMGALVMGRSVGWQGLRVMYSRPTFNKYEKILNVRFREILPERGAGSRRLMGIRMADKIGKFWQAIASGKLLAREAAQTA